MEHKRFARPEGFGCPSDEDIERQFSSASPEWFSHRKWFACPSNDDFERLFSSARRKRSAPLELSAPPIPFRDSSSAKMPSMLEMLERDGTIRPGSTSIVSVFTVNGVKIKVYKADITKLTAEAIVNPTDKKLKHDSGLAKDISKAAGPELTGECEAFIKEKGLVKRTEVMKTTPGKMKNCKAVIHAVGPKWRGFNKQDEYLRQLGLTVKNALKYADTLEYKSIALPAICSDNPGVGDDLDALALVRAIMDYISENGKKGLQEIHVVAIKDNLVWRVSDQVKKTLDDKRQRKPGL